MMVSRLSEAAREFSARTVELASLYRGEHIEAKRTSSGRKINPDHALPLAESLSSLPDVIARNVKVR